MFERKAKPPAGPRQALPARPDRVAPADSPREREAAQLADDALHADTLRAPVSSARPSDGGPQQGQPLDGRTQAEMEGRFGWDFSRVRVSSAGRAADSADVLGARAYAHGSLIVFGHGEYQPGTDTGRRLLAHELAHVVQSGRGQAAGLHLYRRPKGQNGRLSRAQYLEGINWLEENAMITSEEAESFRKHIPESRHERLRIVEGLERRAQAGRSGIARDKDRHLSGKHLITNFSVTPNTIHVDQGEAARISFDVAGASTNDVSAMIIKYETSDERPDSRFFYLPQGPGHKVAVWDGTFTASRREPPETATYRVRVQVSDADGNSEEAFEQIRVVNTTGATVLPRTESGLGLYSLHFDGHEAVLTDSGGHEIKARAISGLTPKNPKNHDHRDYTAPRYAALEDRGPIPPGIYYIDGNSAQIPELKQGGRVKYPSGQGARGWGPFRVPLRPADPSKVHGRSQFFFHLDVHDDGTAGCIGIATADEAKFNQMMALILRLGTGEKLQVEVTYPGP